MTKKEMSEIFAALLLAYPNAEVFRGGIQKLGPTIDLWTASLPEIEYGIGKLAVIRLVRENRFPPAIAELREKAEAVAVEIDAQAEAAWGDLRVKMKLMGLPPAEAVEHALTPEVVRRAVELMGGPEALIRRLPDGAKVYAYSEFKAAYMAAARQGTTGAKEVGSRPVRQIEGRKQ